MANIMGLNKSLSVVCTLQVEATGARQTHWPNRR